MRADLVQKMPVMGNHDDGVRKVEQKLFQPMDGVDVKVVGRLVEQQNVGLCKQRLREEYLHLDGAVQLRHGRIVQRRGYAQAVEEDFDV